MEEGSSSQPEEPTDDLYSRRQSLLIGVGVFLAGTAALSEFASIAAQKFFSPNQNNLSPSPTSPLIEHKHCSVIPETANTLTEKPCPLFDPIAGK